MYNKYMKLSKAIIGAFLVLVLIGVSIPKELYADGCPFPGCYGGYSDGSATYCTCSGYYYMVFAPLFVYGMPAGTEFAGALAVPPVVAYSIFATSPAQKHIGTYVPGAQACYMYAVYGCYPLPTYGMVLPFTGVSVPGS